MRLNLLLSSRFWTSLLLTLCGLIWAAQQATAKLWDVPPLPPVKYAQAPDGMMATIGHESVHFSVCRSSVIHFVASPEAPNTTRQNQPLRGGNQEVDADAPLDRIPHYVRAGSILPLGPEIEYADRKPAGPIELRIYPGADGEFELYQDAGDGYDYEHGAHSVIPLHWSESTRTLRIGQREGTYPGMPATIEMKIVFVTAGHGSGLESTSNPDKRVDYAGQATLVHAP